MCRDWANTCRYFNLQSIHESILILLYFPNPPCLLSSQFQSLDVKIPAEIISSSSQCPIFSLVALLTTNHPTQDSFWPTICLLFNCGQMIVPATVLLHPTILSIINCHSALFTRWQGRGVGPGLSSGTILISSWSRSCYERPRLEWTWVSRLKLGRNAWIKWLCQKWESESLDRLIFEYITIYGCSIMINQIFISCSWP